MKWLMENWQEVVQLTAVHLTLAVAAIVAATLVAVPLGRLASEQPRLGGGLLTALALLYAVPSLPLLVVIPVIIGTPMRSPVNMVVVLTIYGVSVLVGHAAQAFRAVPRDVREAARAIGMGGWRRFWDVELPLAVPVLVAGVRVVASSTVSLVTVGAVIGVQSLGSLFTDGFQRNLVELVLVGVTMTVLLALAVDGLILLVGRALTPWNRVSQAVSA
ncbi:MAG: ABC transporter permease [Propionibacteriaceae bacterium]|nr:ABC transporter permease [Propionibacteriaceae bacterium]